MYNLLEATSQFSIKYQTQISKLCDPLFTHFEINYFFYLYISYQAECCVLGTNIDLVQHYFDLDMHKSNPFFTECKQTKTGVYLYDSVKEDGFQSDMQLLEKKYNTKHSCLLVEKEKNGCQIYGFALPTHAVSRESLLINQASLLKQFTSYFNDEMALVIQQMKDNPVSLSNEINFGQNAKHLPHIHLTDSEKCQFLSQIGFKNKLLLQVDFTRREQECILLFLQGKSAREIAKELFLSTRTIEHHLENIKNKLLCTNRSELFEKLLKMKELGLL